MKKYDKVIIGAGIYGLYSALYCGRNDENVLVIETEPVAFNRATFINQARVHMGYHYPRSLYTAAKSADYFNRFVNEFGESIKSDFDQIYAISGVNSWTNAEQFKKFCKAAELYCEEINPNKYFKNKMVEGAYLTKEYTYDATILKNMLLEAICKLKNVEILYNTKIISQFKNERSYFLELNSKQEIHTDYILNSTYASINQIHDLFGFSNLKIKYELCEIILCKTNSLFENVGITVMDGPFFSIMPFGKTGFHSLTSVTFTPHITSHNDTPQFSCQSNEVNCSKSFLNNCNNCKNKPESAWEYMSSLANKYLNYSLKFSYDHSLFSMKPILKSSEISDSRPTVIRKLSSQPDFYSVLSGKINTVYDLDSILGGSTQ